VEFRCRTCSLRRVYDQNVIVWFVITRTGLIPLPRPAFQILSATREVACRKLISKSSRREVGQAILRMVPSTSEPANLFAHHPCSVLMVLPFATSSSRPQSPNTFTPYAMSRQPSQAPSLRSNGSSAPSGGYSQGHQRQQSIGMQHQGYSGASVTSGSASSSSGAGGEKKGQP
jgi:hypothetical protein